VRTAASTLTGAFILGTIATRFANLGSAGVCVFSTMHMLSIGGTLLGELLMIGTAVVCLQTTLFARWFAVTSVALGVASVVDACAIGYDTTWVQVVAFITVLLGSIWILLVSTFFWRCPELALP
jgi:hypothetical protein